MSGLLKISALLLLAASAAAARAQNGDTNRVDLAVLYTAQRTKQANTANSVWLQGGSVELGADFYRGFGLVADVTGLHTSSVGASGVPFSEVTATFGPRYRWHRRRTAIYGDVLLGEGDAFYSLLPAKGAAQTSADSLALKVGGGIDYGLSRNIALRAVDAAWLRTQYSNTTTGLQNDVRISSGLVFRFR